MNKTGEGFNNFILTYTKIKISNCNYKLFLNLTLSFCMCYQIYNAQNIPNIKCIGYFLFFGEIMSQEKKEIYDDRNILKNLKSKNLFTDKECKSILKSISSIFSEKFKTDTVDLKGIGKFNTFETENKIIYKGINKLPSLRESKVVYQFSPTRYFYSRFRGLFEDQ